MTIFYLAGPIQNVSEAEAKDWRNELTQILAKFDIDTLDPTRNQDQKRFTDGSWDSKAIVELDLEDLAISDALIAFTPQPSVGTSMEIFHMSHNLNKPVYLVCPDRLSPWAEYFATEVFTCFKDLVIYLHAHVLIEV